MPFRSRAQAGQRLAEVLAVHGGDDVVVPALPRGGVPVAAEVATALDAPSDKDLAMAAVAHARGQPRTVRSEEVIAMRGVDEEATFGAPPLSRWTSISTTS